MHPCKRASILAIVHLFLISLFLPTLATAGPLQGGQPAPVFQSTPPATPQHASVQVPVIDDTYLDYIDFVTVSEEEIVSVWATTSNCQYTLRFAPDEPVSVLDTSSPRCDFEAWVEEATTWIAADRIYSIWDHSEWIALFAYTSGAPPHGNPNNPGDSPVPPPETWLEIEQADDCGRAIARASLTSMLCGVGFALGWGATGASMGVFSFTLLGAVLTCALAMMDVQDAITECRDEPDPILVGALDDLLYFDDIRVDGVTVDVVDMEQLTKSLVQIEELLQQPYSASNVASMVEIQGRLIETSAAR